jgi:putative membrane protein
MDFLSFSFLMVACLGVVARVWGVSIRDVLTQPIKTAWPIFLASDILFFGIDMVIDPVALRGNRWFLGQIYYYPQGGSYFGVPVANFLGWAVLGWMILLLWRFAAPKMPIPPFHGGTLEKEAALDRWGPSFLWVSVYLFNLGIALYLGELPLFFSDLCVLAIVVFVTAALKKTFA